MSKDTNSFGHDKALACESRGFVYKKKRMHRFDTPSFGYCVTYNQVCEEEQVLFTYLATLSHP